MYIFYKLNCFKEIFLWVKYILIIFNEKKKSGGNSGVSINVVSYFFYYFKVIFNIFIVYLLLGEKKLWTGNEKWFVYWM